MRFLAALVFAIFLLASPDVNAARGFGSTQGAGTSDHIQWTPFTELSTVSASEWYIANGSGGGGGFGQTFANNNGGSISWVIDYLIPNKLNSAQAFSTTAGVWTWPIAAASATAWHHVCYVYDRSSASNTPVVYMDGSSVTVTTVTPAVGTATLTTTSSSISSSAQNWDGSLSDVAIWEGQLLTANECSALAHGASPLSIRPAALSIYLPLGGTTTGEPDLGPNHIATTVVGTRFHTDAPVRPFSSR